MHLYDSVIVTSTMTTTERKITSIQRNIIHHHYRPTFFCSILFPSCAFVGLCHLSHTKLFPVYHPIIPKINSPEINQPRNYAESFLVVNAVTDADI